ncbi:Sugar efflux transporter for intercellular exchange [Tessaracoccus oleiagri]|uniref:Sugar efflux transporter for intercellular exchange n=1 Tax=Tessaracoccus oleiagri TaxID=686624 RepID=A0A1G9LQY9_9ACTN|nr:Sugar efflux transporter for intercellular exchange [Tessaracoccus oleiagri]
MDIVGLLAWLAAAVGTSTAVPQLARILRTRVTTGVSTKLWQLSLLSAVAWTAHGYLTEQHAITWPTAAVGLLQATILVAVARSEGAGMLRTFLPPVLGGVAMIALNVAMGPVVFGAVITLAPTMGQLAQLRVMHRASDLFGVSRDYLVLNLAAQALWLGYGLLAVEWAMRVSAGTMTVLASVSLAYYLHRRLRLARAAETLAVGAAA